MAVFLLPHDPPEVQILLLPFLLMEPQNVFEPITLVVKTLWLILDVQENCVIILIALQDSVFFHFFEGLVPVEKRKENCHREETMKNT